MDGWMVGWLDDWMVGWLTNGSDGWDGRMNLFWFDIILSLNWC